MKTLALATLLLSTSAFAAEMYTVRITNGSGMPISPAVAYVSKGLARQPDAGRAATPGFVQLCQTGNPSLRAEELKKRGAMQLRKTAGPILPGESLELDVALAAGQALQFEAMYGKSKDACALITIDGSQLHGASHMGGVIASGKDDAVITGAFSQPVVANDSAAEKTAVDRLRALSQPVSGGKIQLFPGYLPSVLEHLERHYGAAETQSLLIPASGAVRYQVVRKH